MKRRVYLTNDQIYDEWLIYKNTGVVTDQLGIYMKAIATHMLGSGSFRGYPQDLKEDMVGEAVLKMMKNLKNLKAEKKQAFFNYLTRCCYCSFITTLSKYYRHKNLIEDLTEQQLMTFKPNRDSLEK